MTRYLRDYQAEAIAAVYSEWAAGRTRTSLVKATGLGKTDDIAWIAVNEVRHGRRPLIMAHRDELLDQLTERCQMWLAELSVPGSVGRVQRARNETRRAITVASVKTICQADRRQLMVQPDLVVTDECFPAGTRIGDKRIEQLREGDEVDSFDELTQQPVRSRVVAIMRSRPSSLVRVRTTLGEVVCTPGHPFLTSHGWVPAFQLFPGAHVLSFTHGATGEVYSVRRGLPGERAADAGAAPTRQDLLQQAVQQGAHSRTVRYTERYTLRRMRHDRRLAGQESGVDLALGAARLLLSRVLGRLVGTSIGNDNSANEPQARGRANAPQQPDALARVASEDGRDSARDQASTASARRQWLAHASRSTSVGRSARLAHGSDLSDTDRSPTMALQAGYRAPGNAGLCRGRRRVTLLEESQGSRRPPRRTTALARVVGVQVLESGRDGTYGGLCPGGVVYNVEVEGTHTYRVGDAGLVVHNCHRATAPTYREVYEWAGAYDERATRMLGVTATMMRGDNAALGDVWQSVAMQRDLLWGIEHGPTRRLVESPLGGLMEQSGPIGEAAPDDILSAGSICGGTPRIGWLVRPRGKAVVTGMDLSGVKVGNTADGGGGKDWQRGELGELVIQDAEQLVQGWIDHAEDRLTMMFVPNVASAKAIEEEFKRKDVPAECVTGSTPAEKRRAVKRRMQSGKTKVRVDVMVGTEGLDIPEIECIYLARPTMLLGLLTQMIGRGTRPAAWVGKLDCLVLDAVGSTRHVKLQSLIDLSPSFEYDTSEIDKLPCPECGSEPGEACHESCECSRCVPAGPARETRRKLIGPTVYEDIELFEEGGLRWLRTNGGLRFLSAGDRFVHLDPEPGGTWAVGHCLREGVDRKGAFLAAGLDLDQAIKMGEALARQLHPRIETPYKGAGRATPKQVTYLAGWGIDASDYTGKAAAEAIDVQVASACLDRLLAAVS